MDSSAISGLIGGVAAIIIGTYVSSRARDSGEEGELRFGVSIVILAWCCLALTVFAVVMFFIDNDVWEKKSELYSVVGLFVGFGLGAFYCFGEYFKVKGNYDEEQIDFQTPWTGRKIEQWSNIESVKFNSSMNWYILKFKSGNKIRLSSFLVGHGHVLELLENKGIGL